MPRKIPNSRVTSRAPRNHVARALAQRGGGGAHQTNRSSQRRASRAALNNQLDDWRDDLEFERELTQTMIIEDGSNHEPSDSNYLH